MGTFLIAITGSIESGEIFGINDIYCKYNFSYGSDWQITAGIEEGISQITTKDATGTFVWNFPLEVTFKSSNPHGWPQLVLSLYGSDFLGNHVARGYGSTFLPITTGTSMKKIHLFVPESSSYIQKISSWIVGRRPEFIDPKLIAQGDGRQVVRVNSKGYVNVKFEVVMKDFRKLGYVSSTPKTIGSD
ncbi:unnamed protein product [Allacma fusca]|uniref:B9 domain-containing protein 1 n=1 Tax=Allacma fusca TaxID=39272 RepID=A0A8J2L468_9HEXA|nr:unnamed protein product [Allacma fusca]